MRKTSIAVSLVLFGMLGLAPACGPEESEDVAVATEGLDSTELMNSELSLLSVSIEGGAALMQLRTPPTPAAIAAAAAARLEAVLQPAGCFQAEVTEAHAVYTFADCSGPRGLLHLTGTMSVDYAVSAQGITATANASQFHVNGATLDIESSALLSLKEGKRNLEVTTRGNGTGPRGYALSYEGHSEYVFADDCFTLNGNWSRRGIAGTAGTVVTDYARCAGACPTSGTIVHTGVRGRTVTIEFDGSGSASWSTSNGRSGTVDLLCAAN